MPAKSKQQQKFMGMVRAAQKGELKDPSPAVKKAAKTMKKKNVEDFASTKHKGLPKKVTNEELELDPMPVEIKMDSYEIDSMSNEDFEKMQQWKKVGRISTKMAHDQLILSFFPDDMEVMELFDKYVEGGDPYVKETVQNVVFNEGLSRAKMVNEDLTGGLGASDEQREKNRWGGAHWTFQPGREVVFDLRGFDEEWRADDPEAGEIAIKNDGQDATIVNQTTYTELGDKDFEYYDIKFNDTEEELYAVSGYHLSGKLDESSEIGDYQYVNSDPGEYGAEVWGWLEDTLPPSEYESWKPDEEGEIDHMIEMCRVNGDSTEKCAQHVIDKIVYKYKKNVDESYSGAEPSDFTLDVIDILIADYGVDEETATSFAEDIYNQDVMAEYNSGWSAPSAARLIADAEGLSLIPFGGYSAPSAGAVRDQQNIMDNPYKNGKDIKDVEF